MDRRIGAQYYTIRASIKTIEDFEESCRKISEMGYKIVQISGTPLGAAEMKAVLDKYDLKVVLTHRKYEDYLADLDEVIEYNKMLGCELCGLGGFYRDYREPGEKMEKGIEEIKAIAKRIREAGLYFAYHNHAFDFAKADGKSIMERLIEETNPEEVYFTVDVYWVHVAGVNPAEFIKRLGKRAIAIHFKDLKSNLDNTTEMAEIGQGNLNWDDIIKACDEAGVKWALVEQDICKRDPFESLKMSYDYLKQKGFH